jgi:hypothetical protein
MKDDNEWVAKIPSYTFARGQNEYGPYVAIGLSARKNGDLYDLSKCTDGFSYSYKGQGHNFKVQTSSIVQEGSDHFTAITSPVTTWTTVSVALADLKQPTWTDKDKTVTFDAAKIYGFIWELKGDDKFPDKVGISANTGELAIKDFRCMGNMPLPPSRPNACTEGAIIEGPGNDGQVPVRKPKLAANVSKSAFAINNGVSLRVDNRAIMEVFSIKGNSVRKMNFLSGNHTVLLNDLPKGLYIVKVNFGNRGEVLHVPIK